MSNDPPSDTHALAAAVRSGECERFDALYRRVAPALYTWARLRILPSMRNRLDAQDVVQEVWARALARFDSYDAASTPFRAWIFRIGKNVLLEALRQLRDPGPRAWTPGSTTKLAALGALPDEVTSFTTELARDEAIQRFLDVAGSLQSVDRELLVAHGLEGLELREVATRLALSNETVKKRWQRLCARLREQAVHARFLALE